MPSGNLSRGTGGVAEEVAQAIVNQFDGTSDASSLFSYLMDTGSGSVEVGIYPTKLALVNLDANGNVTSKGPFADVNWTTASNGEAQNETAVTLQAPSSGANGVGLYSIDSFTPPGEYLIAAARLPGNSTVSGGSSAVFNPGAIRFSWGKATDGTSLDNSTPELRQQLQKMLVETPGNPSPQTSTLEDIYHFPLHSWLVLYTADRSRRLASGDLRLKWVPDSSNPNIQKTTVDVTITNNSGLAFAAAVAAIWVCYNTSNSDLPFDSYESNATKILEKTLSPAITLQNGQQLVIPAGELKVIVS